MAIRIAVNGYGRIGRQVVRAIYEYGYTDQFKVVAINGSGDLATNAHLTRFDSVHGRFPVSVAYDAQHLVLDGKPIPYFSTRDPSGLPWAELGVDLVMECTGAFCSKEKSQAHLDAGAKKVLISAPAKGRVDAMVVYGVNHSIVTDEMTVISNGSCTTNCLAPVAYALQNSVGITKGLMTTVHAVTNDQVITDVRHSDLRRARSGMENMIPTKTGAAKAVGVVLPELAGKLDGWAIRVPTINVSLVDFTFEAGRDTSVEEINQIMQDAAAGSLKGVLGINELPLVSSDFNHSPTASIFDATLTKVSEGNLVKVFAWYDNEWGFSCQMLHNACVMFGVPVRMPE